MNFFLSAYHSKDKARPAHRYVRRCAESVKERMGEHDANHSCYWEYQLLWSSNSRNPGASGIPCFRGAVIIETTGRFDVVINNAGVSYSGPLEAFTLEQVRQQFETNVFSVLRVNRAVLPQMREEGSGLLLQIGSIAGRLAFPFLGLYGATKFALEGLTESYRYELAPFGIDAAIIEPGTYPTTISANRQVAADAERFALYQAGLDAFTAPFYAENRSATPPDPQGVADAIAHVIAQPAGERPLRTVVATVAQRQAPQALNDAATQAMHSFLEALNIPGAALALQGEQERKQR
jgi:NAD(P)-dependent dehydrogenase (short-subunit alcohol dehydrogenase family)